MNEDIKNILNAGVQAPSGSNSQPWSFKVHENEITIVAHPEKDHPILNFGHRGTWIAHGALIENIVIAAKHLCYEIDVKTFPDNSNQNITAKIALKKAEAKKQDIFNAIWERATNRKKYKNTLLTEEEKQYLFQNLELSDRFQFLFTEDKEEMKKIGNAVSKNEVVMLENQELHQLFFDEVVWSKEEEKKKGKGLFIKTMELALPQRLALKLFKYWSVMRVFNKIGAARGIAKSNAVNYASGACVGVITCPDEDKNFLEVGRIMQRIWLRSTYKDLGMHLITGILFFDQNINHGNEKYFSSDHIKIIKEAYQDIFNIFQVKEGVIAMLFRIGHTSKPSGTSIKLDPKIEYN